LIRRGQAILDDWVTANNHRTQILREMSAGKRAMRHQLEAIAMIAVLGSAFLASGCDDASYLELRGQCLRGDELRLLVETYRVSTEFGSHRSKVSDTKSYLVTVDVESTKPIAERAKIYGPLWSVPNKRSSISYQAGAMYSKEDVEAARATPVCWFDTDGQLVRFIGDPARKIIRRDVLKLASDVATWTRQADAKPVLDDLGPMSEDRLQTPSGRFKLAYRNGAAQLFDLYTGEAKEDAWLTKCFAEARSVKDLSNVRLFLTEDLNHLVVSPVQGWYNGHEMVTTFTLRGKTYKRGDFGFAYSRPAPEPIVFPRKLDPNFLAEEPHGAFTIDSQLFLLMNDEESLRLYTPDGKREFRLAASGKPLWPTYPFLRLQHAPANEELIFFDHPITRDSVPNESVLVSRWRYRAGTVARRDVHVIELFERRAARLVPKSVIPVKATP
jgi:hypothetical protein